MQYDMEHGGVQVVLLAAATAQAPHRLAETGWLWCCFSWDWDCMTTRISPSGARAFHCASVQLTYS